MLDLSAPLRGYVRPRVIHQDPPHELGGDTEKLGAVLPLDPALVHHSQIRFVNEGGRLKGMIATLPLEMTPGQAAQFLVNQRHQLLGRFLVAGAPPTEKRGHVWLCGIVHGRIIFPVRAQFGEPFPR